MHTCAFTNGGKIKMGGHILILGGARSGKTAFGERLALKNGRTPAYLATAEALDEEMEARVASHQGQRSKQFTTIEEPLDLAEAILTARHSHDVILIDCLTLWVSNLMGEELDVMAAMDELDEVLQVVRGEQIIIISNEVGLGIVPENPMARSFRDICGLSHQRIARRCESVYFVAAGLPLVMKGQLPQLD